MARARRGIRKWRFASALGATRGRILATAADRKPAARRHRRRLRRAARDVARAGPASSLSPADLRVAGDVTIDRTVLLFGLGLSTVTGPAVWPGAGQADEPLNVNDDLKQSARGATSGRQRRLRARARRGRNRAVARPARRRRADDPQLHPGAARASGLRSGAGADARYRACVDALPTPAQRAEFWERVVRAVGQVPGVQRAAAISRLPLLPGNSTRGLAIKDVPPERRRPSANYRTASPDYFGVMGIPLLRGRAFEDGDREGRPSVAIISARWRSGTGRSRSDRPALSDRRARPDTPSSASSATSDRPRSKLAPQPTFYVPYRQDALPSMTFVAENAGGARQR